jgi:hypothetical protein
MMSVRSVGLRLVGALLILAAVVVGAVGGLATVCNSFDPGCSDQGYHGSDTAVGFGLVTAIGVVLLVSAAVAALRRARRA